jgi:DNA-binding NtrC family response regulator
VTAARVLVVDDDSTIRDVVSLMLKCEGYEVLVADGPRQALEIVKNRATVHLLISDIEMPEMKGTQLVRETARLSPQTAAVLMTGVVNPTGVPNDVLVLKKPFSQRELISAVKAIVHQAGSPPSQSRPSFLGCTKAGLSYFF